MNPLSPNLTDFSDEQLLDRFNSIQQRLRRSGNNPSVMRQLLVLLQECQMEQQRRIADARQKLEGDLNRLIDI